MTKLNNAWPKSTARDQGLDLKSCVRPDGTLDLSADESLTSRLRTVLNAAGANVRLGLDPEAFALDKQRRPMPFPGLASFGDDDTDAAVFYGRSREIAPYAGNLTIDAGAI